MNSLVVQGLDASAMQGGAIPFEAEKARGTSFIWSRCQVGNNPGVDVQFAANTRRAMLAGLYCGAYFFPFPLPHLDPSAQADLFNVAVMLDGHPLGSDAGEMPQAFDLEWPPPEQWVARGCTADQIVDWALACLLRMEQNCGCKPVVYSYPYFLASLSKAKNFALLMTYRLWIAGGNAYVNGDGHIPDLSKEQPPKVAGWGEAWMFWQHDGNGGRRLTNGVDCDFNVFRYSYAELQRLCQDPQAPDSSPPDMLLDHRLIFQETSNLIVEDTVHAWRQERAAEIIAAGI